MLGVIVNTIAVIAGGVVGLIINKGIPERLNKTIMDGISTYVSRAREVNFIEL